MKTIQNTIVPLMIALPAKPKNNERASTASFSRLGSSFNRFHPALMNSIAIVAEKTGVIKSSFPMSEFPGIKNEFGTYVVSSISPHDPGIGGESAYEIMVAGPPSEPTSHST